MAFKDYGTSPADNTELGDGTYIGPNMLRNKVRPALQQLAADGRDLYDEVVARGAGGALPAFIQAGTGAVERTMQGKGRETVSVLDFIPPALHAGIIDGTNTTPLQSYIQAAIDNCKSLPSAQAGGFGPTVPYFVKAARLFFPAGMYLVTDTLWFGILASDHNFTKCVAAVIGDGAVIIAQTSGKPVVDMAGAFGTQWTGLTIFGSPTNSPNVGILLAREGDVQVGQPDYPNNPSAGAHRFMQVNVHGNFSLAPVYNYGSEINFWNGCYFFNATGKFVYVNTTDNSRYHVTSPRSTIATSVQSTYGDFFTGCFFKLSSEDAAGEAVILVESIDFGPSLYNNYIDSTGAAVSANILFRNAASIDANAAAAITQGARIVGNTFEYRADANIIELYDSARVMALTFQGNTANVASGKAHIALGANSLLKGLETQKSSGGDTNGDPIVITKASGAILLNEERYFRDLDPALLGSSWQFLEGALTRDGAYHTINVATLYGGATTAKFALVKVMARTTAAADANDFILRGNGDANTAASFRVCPQVNGISVFAEGMVPLVNGVLQYNIPANFDIARILFRGILL